MINWTSLENQLVLNPRLPNEIKLRFQLAWKGLVDTSPRSLVGIATSGSSGDSQGRLVAITKSAMLVNALSVNDRFRAGPLDVWMKTLPDFHVGGLGILARAHLNGAKVVESKIGKWDAKAFHKELVDSHATLLSLVPTQLFDLVSQKLSCPNTLRVVLIGGARLSEDLRIRALELGWPVHPSYGFTECGSTVAAAISPIDPRLKTLSHADVRIGADDSIEVRSAALLTGQILFSANGAKFEEPIVHGWFKTEDRGKIEADGTLTVLGRRADFVKIGGEGVLMSRLEDQLEFQRALLKFEGDAALIAAADDRLGAKVVLITTVNDQDTKRLADAFNSKVAPFERIREAFTVSEIPRSALGKLLRSEALALVGLKPFTNV